MSIVCSKIQQKRYSYLTMRGYLATAFIYLIFPSIERSSPTATGIHCIGSTSSTRVPTSSSSLAIFMYSATTTTKPTHNIFNRGSTTQRSIQISLTALSTFSRGSTIIPSTFSTVIKSASTTTLCKREQLIRKGNFPCNPFLGPPVFVYSVFV